MFRSGPPGLATLGFKCIWVIRIAYARHPINSRNRSPREGLYTCGICIWSLRHVGKRGGDACQRFVEYTGDDFPGEGGEAF